MKGTFYKKAQNVEIQKLLNKIGIIPVFKDGEGFTELTKEDQPKVQKLVKDLGNKAE